MGLPDSGLRSGFHAGGAVREADPDKPKLEAISPYALNRLGMLLAKADKKYEDAGGCRNWEKGMSIMRYVGGILRHAGLYVLRDRREDHPAAIMWNAMCIAHHEEVGAVDHETGEQFSFADLDDRPVWTSSVEGMSEPPIDAEEEMTGRSRSYAIRSLDGTVQINIPPDEQPSPELLAQMIDFQRRTDA